MISPMKTIKPFKKVPKEEWPSGKYFIPTRMQVWRSKEFLVQVFQEPDEVKRVTVNRVKSDETGWKAEINAMEPVAERQNQHNFTWYKLYPIPF